MFSWYSFPLKAFYPSSTPFSPLEIFCPNWATYQSYLSFLQPLIGPPSPSFCPLIYYSLQLLSSLPSSLSFLLSFFSLFVINIPLPAYYLYIVLSLFSSLYLSIISSYLYCLSLSLVVSGRNRGNHLTKVKTHYAQHSHTTLCILVENQWDSFKLVVSD